MKPSADSRSPASRGTALVAAIVALVMLQLLIVAVSFAGARDQDLTSRRLEASRAFYAAEAVANMAIREIARDEDEDSDGGIGSVFSVNPQVAPVIGPGGGKGAVTTTSSNGVVTARAVGSNGLSHRTISANIQRVASAGASQGGLFVEMWVASSAVSTLATIPWASPPGFATVMPDVNTPSQGSVPRWSGGPSGRYGVRYTGLITIPTTGTWSFRTTSDDGSDLWINGVRVVNNDGLHGSRTVTGTTVLTAGTYTFECRLFENGGSSNLWAEWREPGSASWALIPSTAFSCTPTMVIPPVAVATSISVAGASASPVAGIDGYNSNAGAYGAGNTLTSGVPVSINATAASSWTVSGDAVVTADGLVGPGGSASSVIRVTAPATMTGTNATLPTRLAALLQGFPLPMPASSGAHNSNASLTISSNRRYTSLSAGGNAVIMISGNVAVVINGDLTLSGTSSIELAPNSTLDLYVGGNLTLGGSARINDVGKDPKRVRVFLTNAASRDVTLGGGSRMHAMVRSPFGRLVVGHGTGSTAEFFGTFHGDGLSVVQHGRLHADVGAYPRPSGSGSASATTTIRAWSQTP